MGRPQRISSLTFTICMGPVAFKRLNTLNSLDTLPSRGYCFWSTLRPLLWSLGDNTFSRDEADSLLPCIFNVYLTKKVQLYV